ncbi:unnamed protein product [Somion occarium]|uniref:TFIIS N-terminal domain-containing protein n=1 Tax=Somion occarium TaxID=3059160 RepID=A0ABP1D4F3_9APHY
MDGSVYRRGALSRLKRNHGLMSLTTGGVVDHLHPCGDDATRRNDPRLRRVVRRWKDAIVADLAQDQRGTVEEDVGDDTGDDTVRDVVAQGGMDANIGAKKMEMKNAMPVVIAVKYP